MIYWLHIIFFCPCSDISWVISHKTDYLPVAMEGGFFFCYMSLIDQTVMSSNYFWMKVIHQDLSFGFTLGMIIETQEKWPSHSQPYSHLCKTSLPRTIRWCSQGSTAFLSLQLVSIIIDSGSEFQLLKLLHNLDGVLRSHALKQITVLSKPGPRFGSTAITFSLSVKTAHERWSICLHSDAPLLTLSIPT